MGELFDRDEPSTKLDWTGERLTAGAGPQVEIEHLHRYFWARSLCRGLDVLDVASGEGYGSALLAQTARSVVGVELDGASVTHAQGAYHKSNLRFLTGDARNLPLPDGCVDLVVSFETIEHFFEHDQFVAEVRRVLRPGGRFLVSSPERDAYSPAGSSSNPYHVRELTRAEFLDLLRHSFSHVAVQAQRDFVGSALVTDTLEAPSTRGDLLTFERRGPNRFEVSQHLPRAMYLIATASDRPIEDLPDSLYIEQSNIEQILVDLPAEREQLVRTGQALAEAGGYARHLEAELAARDRQIADAATAIERARVEREALLAAAAEAQRAAAQALTDREVQIEALTVLKQEVAALRGEHGVLAGRVAEEELHAKAAITQRNDLAEQLAGARNLGELAGNQCAALAAKAVELQSVATANGAQRDEAFAVLAETQLVAQKHLAERNLLASRLADANADAQMTILRTRQLEAELATASSLSARGRQDALQLASITDALTNSKTAQMHMQREAGVERRKLLQLAEDRAAVQAELDRLLHSSAWRMSWPLRALVDRHPTARRIIRRSAKFAWWTLTLQLSKRLSGRRPPPMQEPVTSDDAARIEEHPAHEADVPDARLAPNMDEKFRQTASMRAGLQIFLADDNRLAFPATDAPAVSVLIVTWNQAHLTLHALRALQAQRDVSFEIILVDNASTDATGLLLDRLDGVHIVRNTENRGFVLGCNQGAAYARGEALLLLNSDAFVRDGALSAALSTLKSADDIGAVGGRLILPSGRLQEAGSIVWSDGSSLGYGRGLPPCAGEAMFRREVDYCSGAFLLTPLSLWNQLDGFDPAYAPAYYEEADYCMRLHARKFRVIYEPAAIIDHYEFGSEARQGDAIAASRANRDLFEERHSEELRHNHLPPAEPNILAARSRRVHRRRRLLVIDNDVPIGALGSGYPRAREMLVTANNLGWFVTLFPLHRLEIDWNATRSEIPWEIEIVSDSGAPALADFLVKRHLYYDVVLVSRPENMSFVRGVVRQHPHTLDGARLIYDAEALVAPRDLARALMEGQHMTEAYSGAHLTAELALVDKADAVVCVNETEAAVFRAHGAVVHVLSHVTSCATDPPEFASRHGFLFVGRLLEKHAPNWNGLQWFLQHVWPLIRLAQPEAQISVVGHLHPDHGEMQCPGVCLLGPVADLTPVYDAARVFVAPVRFAAGIPIKILEAAAAGIPVAGTRLMARQLGWDRDVELVAEDEPETFARAAINLYQNVDTWRAMQRAAQMKVAGEYNASKFVGCMQTLLDGSPPRDLAAVGGSANAA